MEEALLDVRVPLTQNQYDALVSLVFNIGAGAFRGSTLLRLLNNSNYAAVPDQMRRWIHVNGKISNGLKKRREEEVKQWLTP
jgi:lysozyme